MVQVCQNSAGIFCQNGAGSEHPISVEEEQDRIIIIFHTSNASLIIERSKCTIKQSEDWQMSTVNPNVYLRDGTSLGNLLRLFCLLY